MLVVLYWAIRAYEVLIIVWAVMTWTGLNGSNLHNIIGLPVVPVLNLFSFLSFGGIGLGALVVLLLLNWVANLLAKQIAQSEPPGAAGFSDADAQAGEQPPRSGPPSGA